MVAASNRTGMRAGSRIGSPMSTSTLRTLPFEISSSSVLIPGIGLDAQGVFAREPMLPGVLADAADAVAAHLPAAAVGVVHLHAHGGHRRGLNEDEAVRADPLAPRAHFARQRRRVGNLQGEAVDVHVVVTGAVHLGERDLHGSTETVGNRLASYEIVERLAGADDVIDRAVDEHLGRARAGVVVRGHDEAVGARAADREQLARPNGW